MGELPNGNFIRIFVEASEELSKLQEDLDNKTRKNQIGRILLQFYLQLAQYSNNDAVKKFALYLSTKFSKYADREGMTVPTVPFEIIISISKYSPQMIITLLRVPLLRALAFNPGNLQHMNCLLDLTLELLTSGNLEA